MSYYTASRRCCRTILLCFQDRPDTTMISIFSSSSSALSSILCKRPPTAFQTVPDSRLLFGVSKLQESKLSVPVFLLGKLSLYELGVKIVSSPCPFQAVNGVISCVAVLSAFENTPAQPVCRCEVVWVSSSESAQLFFSSVPRTEFPQFISQQNLQKRTGSFRPFENCVERCYIASVVSSYEISWHFASSSSCWNEVKSSTEPLRVQVKTLILDTDASCIMDKHRNADFGAQLHS